MQFCLFAAVLVLALVVALALVIALGILVALLAIIRGRVTVIIVELVA